jgi:uncharacterized protein (DUF302 family)
MQEAPSDIVRISVAQTFDIVREKVLDIVTSAGMTVFAEIDHAAGAAAAGLDMPATVVIIYGSPKGGTPIMTAVPDAALDLPLHVLVRAASSAETIVAFHPIATILETAGVSPDNARRLAPAQALIADGLRSLIEAP